jgi:osmoprotectant transport system permease protein
MDVIADLATWFSQNWDGQAGYLNRTWEHVTVSFWAVAAAAGLAVPLGAYLGHARRLEVAAVAIVNIGRAIPSFGVVALALPFTIRIARNVPFIDSGLGFFPTFVAVFLLALPPIFTNTYTGVREVDPGTIEAGRGMGLSELQLLRRVEMPLASPVIITGLRISAVQVVATVPLGALVAYGGLGRYIIDGFALQDDTQILAGAILVALLAILTELAFSFIEHRVVPTGVGEPAKTDPAAAMSVPP